MQAEWKPESPYKFGNIAELVKSVDSLKVEQNKIQGSISCLQYLYGFSSSVFMKINTWATEEANYVQDKGQNPPTPWQNLPP